MPNGPRDSGAAPSHEGIAREDARLPTIGEIPATLKFKSSEARAGTAAGSIPSPVPIPNRESGRLAIDRPVAVIGQGKPARAHRRDGRREDEERGQVGRERCRTRAVEEDRIDEVDGLVARSPIVSTGVNPPPGRPRTGQSCLLDRCMLYHRPHAGPGRASARPESSTEVSPMRSASLAGEPWVAERIKTVIPWRVFWPVCGRPGVRDHGRPRPQGIRGAVGDRREGGVTQPGNQPLDDPVTTARGAGKPWSAKGARGASSLQSSDHLELGLDDVRSGEVIKSWTSSLEPSTIPPALKSPGRTPGTGISREGADGRVGRHETD